MKYSMLAVGTLMLCAAAFFVNALERITQEADRRIEAHAIERAQALNLAFGRKPHPKGGGACETTVCTFEGRWP